MYNEYPDLIYEGLISDSFYTDIVEEGLGESIKSGFGRLKEICKKTFDKIIEKLKQFISNVRNYITKLINKFKKKDNNSESSSNEKQNEDTKKEEKSKEESSEEKEEKKEETKKKKEDDGVIDVDDWIDMKEYNSKYNKYRSERRVRRPKASYASNSRKVKVVYKYDVDPGKLKTVCEDFKSIFGVLGLAFRDIIDLVTRLEKEERTSDDEMCIKRHDSWRIDEYVDDYINEELKKYPGYLNKTDDEILTELIDGYGSDKNFEKEMVKRETEDFCDRYKLGMEGIQKYSQDVIKRLEEVKERATKAFEIIDTKLKSSAIEKSNYSEEEKKKLKAFGIAGNKAKGVYQKVVRFSSLFIKIQNVMVSNIASIKVEEI